MIDPRHFKRKKKADVAETLRVFGHVGLLVNEPPGPAECKPSPNPYVHQVFST